MSLYADQSGIISIDEMDQPTDVTELFLIGFLVAEKKKGEVKHPNRTDSDSSNCTFTADLHVGVLLSCSLNTVHKKL